MNTRADLCVVGVRAHVQVHARGVAWRACAYAQVKAIRARQKCRQEAAKTAKLEEERNKRSSKGRKFPPPFVFDARLARDKWFWQRNCMSGNSPAQARTDPLLWWTCDLKI
jgi:hypothetical protein